MHSILNLETDGLQQWKTTLGATGFRLAGVV